MSKIYEFNVEDAKGNTKPLSNYAGKVMLVVNTASHCGFTPQYKELQELHNDFHEKASRGKRLAGAFRGAHSAAKASISSRQAAHCR